ncbi:DUF485 domain-containing protein [Kitasatospora sp. NPDC059571]|uniref:DUF485 domain-containing protein n=1 Tax=Kitasatospora sp. NPDC059571 TaxID=3346871 RepID=UPI00368CA970
MHPMSHQDGWPAEPAPRPPFVPQPPVEPDLESLRGSSRRLDRGLITANAVCFLFLVFLAGAAPGLLATEIIGRINLGLLLCCALGVLAFLTSTGYDLRSGRSCDPVAARIRDRHREAAAPPAAPAPRRAGHRRAQW